MNKKNITVIQKLKKKIKIILLLLQYNLTLVKFFCKYFKKISLYHIHQKRIKKAKIRRHTGLKYRTFMKELPSHLKRR